MSFQKSLFCGFVLALSLCGVSVLFACSEKLPENAPLTEQALREQAAAAAELEAITLQEKAISQYMSSLTDEQLITQLFAIGIDGSDCLHSYAKKEFARAAPGSFLLFKANIAQTSEEVLSFTQSVSSWFIENNLVPPILMIDNEGGAVYRLQGVASPLLSPEKTAAYFTATQAETYYHLIGKQMKLLGIQMNLAPLVEVKTKENAAFLGNRSFGSLDTVAQYASAAVRGFEQAGIGAVIKHYPGNTDVDPHTGLPTLSVTHREFIDFYEAPFSLLLRENPSGVLMSHIIVESEDSGVPACLSSQLVRGRLRSELGFDGVIVSDDLFMGALSNNGYPPEKAVITAIKAGVDILMMSEKRYGAVYDSVYECFKADDAIRASVYDSVKRILRLKIKLGIFTVNDGENPTLVPSPLRPSAEILSEFAQVKAEADSYFSDVTKN